MFSDDALNFIKPSLINAFATGTKYSSFESVDLMPSFKVLLAEESCAHYIFDIYGIISHRKNNSCRFFCKRMQQIFSTCARVYFTICEKKEKKLKSEVPQD